MPESLSIYHCLIRYENDQVRECVEEPDRDDAASSESMEYHKFYVNTGKVTESKGKLDPIRSHNSKFTD
jgi:hypothetical protein